MVIPIKRGIKGIVIMGKIRNIWEKTVTINGKNNDVALSQLNVNY